MVGDRAKRPRSQCWRRFRNGAHDGAVRRGLPRPEGNALALEWPPPHGRGGPYRRKSMTACASSDQMTLAPNGPQCTLCNSQRCCAWVFTATHRGMPCTCTGRISMLRVGQPIEIERHVAALDGLRSFPVQPVRDFANGLKVAFFETKISILFRRNFPSPRGRPTILCSVPPRMAIITLAE